MQKDVIYIDVEDDITAIIGKVKSSEEKIVALVPPKHVGAIQSAVNLKLVNRAAEQANKKLVIISGNAALTALAGSAGVLVAKNLQSRPEMAEIPALEVDDGEDVIDGAELPIGEHAKQAGGMTEGAALKAVEAGGLGLSDSVKKPNSLQGIEKPKSKSKIPDFGSFRKKLFIFGGLGVLLIAFLVWAIFFAPTATIIITARTSQAPLNSQITVSPSLKTDLTAGTIKAETKTLQTDVSVPFTATGKKDVGDKAAGTVQFTTNSISALGTIPAGTQLTSAAGLVYTTNADVTLTVSNATTGVDGAVTAADTGTKYNGGSGNLSGAPSGVNATFTAPTSGGTDKTVTIVQQSDVASVSGQVNQSSSSDNAKKQLVAQFGNDYVVLPDTFTADTGAVKPSPAVGQESTDGKATLAGQVTYKLTAVLKSEVSKYLDSYFAQQIDGRHDQRVYDNGLKKVTITNISPIKTGFSANVATNGQIGPNIDETALKNFARGKKLGDIQSHVESIVGVDNVDVRFSPFWVNTAPGDVKRIQIEFKINGA